MRIPQRPVDCRDRTGGVGNNVDELKLHERIEGLFFQNIFYDYAYNGRKADGAVVGYVMWVTFFMYWAYNGQAPFDRYHHRCMGKGEYLTQGFQLLHLSFHISP